MSLNAPLIKICYSLYALENSLQARRWRTTHCLPRGLRSCDCRWPEFESWIRCWIQMCCHDAVCKNTCPSFKLSLLSPRRAAGLCWYLLLWQPSSTAAAEREGGNREDGKIGGNVKKKALWSLVLGRDLGRLGRYKKNLRDVFSLGLTPQSPSRCGF